METKYQTSRPEDIIYWIRVHHPELSQSYLESLTESELTAKYREVASDVNT